MEAALQRQLQANGAGEAAEAPAAADDEDDDVMEVDNTLVLQSDTSLLTFVEEEPAND